MSNDLAIKALQNTINDVENRRLAAMNAAALPFDKEISQLKNAIILLKGGNRSVPYNNQTGVKKRGRPSKQVQVPNTYPYGQSVLTRFLFILKEADCFLDIGEIAERVNGYEPDKKLEDLKRQFGKHVNKYRSNGDIVTEKIEGGKYIFYGLPSFMKDGKILEKHINLLM